MKFQTFLILLFFSTSSFLLSLLAILLWESEKFPLGELIPRKLTLVVVALIFYGGFLAILWEEKD